MLSQYEIICGSVGRYFPHIIADYALCGNIITPLCGDMIRQCLATLSPPPPQ